MKDGLQQVYETLFEKNMSEGTVSGTATKKASSGDSFDGANKQAPGMGAKDAAKHVKKPANADANLQGVNEEKELSNMLPKSKFDSLFKAQLVEEEGGIDPEESPLEKTGGEGFSDEQGDFPGEGSGDDVGEEVDVATELRMIIDRLTEVAERLGAYEGTEDGVESPVEDGDIEGAEGLEDSGNPVPESHQIEEAASKGGPGKGKQDGKLQSFPDKTKTMQSKGNMKVKSSFTPASGKAKASAGPGKGSHDGKLAPMKKTTLGPKMSMKADAKGPMGKQGAGIFDAV